MRKKSILALALLVALAIPLIATAAPSTTTFRGTGFAVVGVIHHVDDAGVETTGYLFGVGVRSGEIQNVPFDQALIFAGERYYPELGYSVPFLGAVEASYQNNGMNGATIAGTVEAQPFYDGSSLPPDPLPALVIEVDLTFRGTGATYAQPAHYISGNPGEVYALLDALRWRFATATGTILVDGSAGATLDTAQILGETSSEFNLVVLH
jgi:hypothetical protein